MEPNTQSAIPELIEKLLREDFAEKNGFVNLNLESIGKILEETREGFEHPNTLSPEFLAEMESYERCKSTYCLLLLQYELLNYQDLPEQSLSQLQNPVDSVPDFIADEENSMSEKTMLHIGISGPLVRVPSNEGKLGTYLSIAHLLSQARERKDIKISETHSIRIQGLCHLFDLESEVFRFFLPLLACFWPQKKAAILELLDGKSHGFEFHPSLKSGLEILAKSHREWLAEEKFPLAACVNSLKYVFGVQQLEKFKPALLDVSILTLLFGRESEMGEVPIINRLGVPFSDAQAVEFAFRLTRLQKSKAKLSSISNEIAPDDLIQIQDDCAALKKLFETESAATEHLQGVA